MSDIHVSGSDRVRTGLEEMLTEAIGPHGYTFAYVELPFALFLIEIAKRAEDREVWFPHGKWATIQSIQAQTDKALEKVWRKKP